jgi:hypothetical protein
LPLLQAGVELKKSGDEAAQGFRDRTRSTKKDHDRIVSIFDPEARPIKKGSRRIPVEFGRKLCITETIVNYGYTVYKKLFQELGLKSILDNLREQKRVLF